MTYSVDGAEFEQLEDAVTEAVRVSKLVRRTQITVPHIKGSCGYAGQCRVVASFLDGYDINSIAADEDGNPDYDLRATSLT